MEYEAIRVDQIDSKDELFFIHNNNEQAIKDKSITTLYSPIWLQRKAKGYYRVVDGFLVVNRLSDQTKERPLSAKIFPAEFAVVDLWLLRIDKRSVENNLSPFAVLESACKIMIHLGLTTLPDEIVNRLSQIGITGFERSLEELSHRLDFLRCHCRFCDLYGLTYKEIQSLARRQAGDLEAFSTILQDLTLKGNKLQSMLTLLDELAKGYGFSSEKLLANSSITHILKDSPVHTRYKALKSALTRLRWPILEQSQEEWNRLVKRYDVPGKLAIMMDPFFEANTIEFSLKASSLSEFRELFSQLEGFANSQEFAKLFDFI